MNKFRTGPSALARTLRIVGGGVNAAVSILDRLDMPLMVMDSFLNAKFPNQSDFLSPEMVVNAKWQTIKAQIDAISAYNSTVVDVFNSNPNNIADSQFPMERGQFPIIMGPLDKLEPTDEMAQLLGAEYRNVRAKILIYTVAEQLLRTPGNKHRVQLYNNPVSTFPGTSPLSRWNDTISRSYETNPNVSLVDLFMSGVNGKQAFTRAQKDNLYRDAYTAVCNTYGGVVYEDVHESDDSSWKGRPRFQCGFASQTQCNNHAKDWLQNQGLTGGQYAEWYSPTEITSILTQIPDSSTTISGCTYISTIKSYSVACSVNVVNSGACIATTPYMATICSEFKGVYDYNRHECTYTQEYCQTMGMCYDRVNKVCQLPHDTMFALSMFVGGDGVTREFIKIHGCGFDENGADPTNIVTSADKFILDLFKSEGIREGVRATFAPENTQGAIGFTMLAGAAAEGVLLTVAEASSRVNIAVTVVVLTVIGILIGVTVIQSNQQDNQKPPSPTDYPKEYAITGLTNDGTQAKSCGLAEGWRTKPIRVHTFANWPPLADARTVTRVNCTTLGEIPSCTRIDFFSRTSVFELAIAFFSDMRGAVNSYTGGEKNRTKNYCYNVFKLRAGSNAINNDAFCIDYKPPAKYTDVNNIGELASDAIQTVDGQSAGSESYVVNRTWTDGTAMDIPQYPTASDRQGAEWGNRPELWYYQLVYDRGKMVPDPATGMPKKLWDTGYLQYHFTDSTIQAMRVYYCRNALEKDAKDHKDDDTYLLGGTIDDRCWGFLNIDIPKYKYYRMALPA